MYIPTFSVNKHIQEMETLLLLTALPNLCSFFPISLRSSASFMSMGYKASATWLMGEAFGSICIFHRYSLATHMLIK